MSVTSAKLTAAKTLKIYTRRKKLWVTNLQTNTSLCRMKTQANRALICILTSSFIKETSIPELSLCFRSIRISFERLCIVVPVSEEMKYLSVSILLCND